MLIDMWLMLIYCNVGDNGTLDDFMGRLWIMPFGDQGWQLKIPFNMLYRWRFIAGKIFELNG